MLQKTGMTLEKMIDKLDSTQTFDILILIMVLGTIILLSILFFLYYRNIVLSYKDTSIKIGGSSEHDQSDKHKEVSL